MKASPALAAVFLLSILTSHGNNTPPPECVWNFHLSESTGPITNIGRGAPVTRVAASECAGQMHVDDRSMRQRNTFDHRKTPNQNGLPTWTDSFAYQGLDFTYRMVGTDPKAGSQTHSYQPRLSRYDSSFPTEPFMTRSSRERKVPEVFC
jgi:hypothetical protein